MQEAPKATTYSGTCHCGGIKVELTSAVAPEAAMVRECQCSFCRQHGAKAVSDPAGKVCFTELTAGALHRYTFGLRTADFLVCANCGAYMGCVLTDGDATYGIANILTFKDKALFTASPIKADYDSETKAERIERRRTKWTPAEVVQN